MKNNIKIKILFALFTSFGIMSCNKVLDKTNLTAVDPNTVWSNPSIVTAYLNNLYASVMPGNTYGSANGTDEGVAYQHQTNNWLLGTATFDSRNDFSQYNNIRSANTILDNIDKATFDQTSKNNIKGQALFWRAWIYYGLVHNYGGVPLILHAQPPTSDLSKLDLPRSKTSDCVKQILSDLDSATLLLPESWSGSDLGRIDQGASMAFKGRVLNFFASPLFNGVNGTVTWQMAYDANLAAKNYLDAHGKGLFSPYKQIWGIGPSAINSEYVMFHFFHYPEATYFQGGLVPLNWSKDDVGYDRPSLELVNAFPMKDGSAWNAQARIYDTLFKSRDDRFYADIYYNGDPYQYIQGMQASNTYLWTYFDKVTDYNSNVGITGQHNQVTSDPLWSNSSFYRIKAIDPNINTGWVYNAAVNWIEIRYAEVLMNYGEAANEIGKTNEALNVLYQVRQRAGVLPGATSNYGITASSQSDIRTVYQNERFVEFCFENKRWDDLRRWKLFGYMRSLPQRHGIGIELKAGYPDVQPLDDINTIWNHFTYTVMPTDQSDILLPDQYYIYGIPKAVTDRNPQIQQNNNWGGNFDPLQ